VYIPAILTLFLTSKSDIMNRFIILLVCCGFVCPLFAQDKDSTAKNKTELVVAISYNSGLNYYGRVDSVKSTGFYPTAGVNFKNGIYLHSSFVFINNASYNGYAATIAEAGYQFKNKKESWSGNIFVNKFFYKDNTGQVQSALKGTAGINLAHLNKIINLNAGADVKLSDKIDIGVSAGLDHTFRIENIGKGVIVIDPSAYLYAGTQNFTNTYYQEKNFLFLPAGEEAVTTNSRKFSILSYELSCPVVYGLGKMNLVLSPAYVIPQNLVVVPGRPDLSERGASLFYLTSTLKFTF
jgi:hypothetical protein